MQKPRAVKTIEDASDALDVIFSNAQDKELKMISYTGTDVWPVDDGATLYKDVLEKQLMIAKNTADDGITVSYRLYTKIAGKVKYIALS